MLGLNQLLLRELRNLVHASASMTGPNLSLKISKLKLQPRPHFSIQSTLT